MSEEKTARIRELNDAFRTTIAGGRVMVAAGVEAQDDATKETLLDRVRTYNNFTEDNDPNNEHDFGSIDIEDQRFFWKIDLYEERVVKSPFRLYLQKRPICCDTA